MNFTTFGNRRWVMGCFTAIAICTVLLVGFVWLLLSDSGEERWNVQVQPTAEHTLLIYMVGSDLESGDGAGSSDLNEMMKANSSDNVNVIVQTGGAASWELEQLDADRTQRWQVKDGELTELYASGEPLNMGKVRTLSDFLQFGTTFFPAERTSLILWDHGGGSIAGIGNDELYNFDALRLSELQTALESGTKQLDTTMTFIGFDACLMGNIETAQVVAPYADYMVGSEELEPGHGWDYTAIINSIIQQPAASGDVIGRAIVKGFKKQAREEKTDREITLSVLDLTQLDPLIEAIDTWAQALADKWLTPAKIATFARSRGEAQSFGRGSAPEDNTDMTDLADLVSVTYDAVPAESEDVLDALDNVIVESLTSDIAPNATGLSIYFPYVNQDSFDGNMAIFKNLQMPPSYTTLIDRFAEQMLLRTKFDLPSEDQKLVTRSANELKTTYVIPANQRDNIADMVTILGQFTDEKQTETRILGTDNFITYNEKTGALSTEWEGVWLTLDGQFITMDLIQAEKQQFLYAIPALLNGADVDLYVLYDEAKQTYDLLGAWQGIDERYNFANRDIKPLQQGDLVVPLLEMLDEETGESSYVDGNTITVGANPPVIEVTELPVGTYNLGFMLTDYAGNNQFTEYDVYEVYE